MNFLSALLYPIVLLLPAAGASESDSEASGLAVGGASQEQAVPPALWPQYSEPLPGGPYSSVLIDSVEPPPGWQVHIEQRVQIRIAPRPSGSPRPPVPARPDMFIGIPAEGVLPHFTERKVGKCLAIAGIGGVQPDRGSRLLLYMRDRRLIVAELERSCRAKDFYSGFYLARTPDGQLCVDRDTLLSRSGMNCKLTRLRQLVESDH